LSASDPCRLHGEVMVEQNEVSGEAGFDFADFWEAE
jgi:hypothetical protein